MVKNVDMNTELAQKIEVHLAKIAAESNAIRQLLIEEKPVFPKEKEALIAKRICIQCGEVVPAGSQYTRGCDSKHYRATMRAIEKNEITEREAIEQGMLYYPEVTGRPKAISPVRKYIAQKEIAASMQQQTNATSLDKKQRKTRGKQKP